MTPSPVGVLSQAQRTGDFSSDCTGGFDGSGNCLGNGQLFNPISGTPYAFNQVPVNPVIANYINNYMPLPNSGDNTFTSSPLASINDDQGIVHWDWSVTS